MNYKLAKQLEEAGYDIEGWEDGMYKEPTLSELIDACGDKFVLLEREKHSNGNCWWSAVGEVNGKRYVADEYDTPLEAVAKLYIKLKEKDLIK